MFAGTLALFESAVLLKKLHHQGKTRTQLNLQLQRMMGQQSLGEFMGIRLDAQRVRSFDHQLVAGLGFVHRSGQRIRRKWAPQERMVTSLTQEVRMLAPLVPLHCF